MKIGDLVKRDGTNPLRVNGLVLETKVFKNPSAGIKIDYAMVMWPDKVCEWTDVTWLRRVDNA